MAAETKQRRGTSGQADEDKERNPVGNDTDTHECAGEHDHKGTGPQWCSRAQHYIAPAGFLLMEVLCYACIRSELLQPTINDWVWLFSLVFHVLLVSFVASWAGVFIHGPGVVPDAAMESPHLPSELLSALDVGSTGAAEQHCRTCQRWKPRLAYHCSACRRCGMWVTHHSARCMTCIGSKNLRCYALWGMYGQSLTGFLIPLMVMRGLSSLPSDAWVLCRVLGVFLLAVLSCFTTHRKLVRIVALRADGWPCASLKADLVEVGFRAQSMYAECVCNQQDVVSPADVAALAQALEKLQPRRGLWIGPLGYTSKPKAFLGIFGKWPALPATWAVPGLPGTADPLAKTVYNGEVCAAWAALASLVAENEERIDAWHKQAQARYDALVRMADQATVH